MGKDSPSPPPAPDYKGAAVAQGAANKESAIATAQLGNPNVNSPYGSQTVSYQNDPITGNPIPTVNQSLNPQSQDIFNAQQQTKLGLAGLGQQGIGTAQSIMGQPFNYSGPSIQTSVGQPNLQSQINTQGVAPIPSADPQARQHAEDMAYQAATSRLDPQWAQRNSMQDTQLRNQGLVPGGEAYDAAKRDQGYQQNDAYLQAQANAVNQGLQNQQAQFGMGLSANQAGFGQAQQQGAFANQAAGQGYGMGLSSAQFGNTAAQQGLAQQLQLRNQPLNEITALMSGSQVTNPQFPNYTGATVNPANYAQVAQQQGQYAGDVYNQQVGAQNANTSGLYGLGAAGLSAYGMMNKAAPFFLG